MIEEQEIIEKIKNLKDTTSRKEAVKRLRDKLEFYADKNPVIKPEEPCLRYVKGEGILETTKSFINKLIYDRNMENTISTKKAFAFAVFAVVLSLGIGYAAFMPKKPTAVVVVPASGGTPEPTAGIEPTVTPEVNEITKMAVFRSPLALSPASATGKAMTLYDPLLEAWFEGYDRLYYEFSYPEADFSVKTSGDNRIITIEEKASKAINTITVSYEGGRGFTPEDYWNEVLKKNCLDCQRVDNQIEIKDAVGLITFSGVDKEWVIFNSVNSAGGPIWLFAAEINKPTEKINKILSSFTLVEPSDKVKLFYISIGASTGNGATVVGCGDEAIGIDRPIPVTATPLKNSLEAILLVKESIIKGPMIGETGLYNALYRQDWELENVSIVEEEAIIKLSGKYVDYGTCEGPRAKAQLEQTALQFPTVKKVSIFLNEISLDKVMSGAGE
jgi:hypothetical protein